MSIWKLIISIPKWLAIGIVIGVLLALTDYDLPKPCQ